MRAQFTQFFFLFWAILPYSRGGTCPDSLKRLVSPQVVFLGYGAVAQATLPILREKVAHSGITVLDFEDRSEAIKKLNLKDISFNQTKITPDNLSTKLSQFLKPGDVLIDLAWNIDAKELLTWCKEHGVRYVNTSVEVWNPYAYGDAPLTERTLYHRHQELVKHMADWGKESPTAVLEHGANPGLISHFAKQGILDIAAKYIADGAPESKTPAFKDAYANQRFNELAMLMNIKVIHISERDTQRSSRPKEPGEFVGTWSNEGLYEEGITGSELGFGTHEKKLPEGAVTHESGPKSQIVLPERGMNKLVRSMVPGHSIVGRVIRHGEARSLAEFLSVEKDGKTIFRPTVHYAYSPSGATIESLDELRGNGYKHPTKTRIMNDDITSGEDILGALLMGHRYNSWWTGSNLSIDEARRLVPGQNATTVQVAISVVAAVDWITKNPNRGVVLPEDLPHQDILNMSKPYLGQWISQPFDWTPLKDRPTPLPGAKNKVDKSDPWQFQNFEISDE